MNVSPADLSRQKIYCYSEFIIHKEIFCIRIYGKSHKKACGIKTKKDMTMEMSVKKNAYYCSIQREIRVMHCYAFPRFKPICD